jgi:hypothetical protein
MHKSMLKKEIIHNSKLATIEEKGATEFAKQKHLTRLNTSRNQIQWKIKPCKMKSQGKLRKSFASSELVEEENLKNY